MSHPQPHAAQAAQAAASTAAAPGSAAHQPTGVHLTALAVMGLALCTLLLSMGGCSPSGAAVTPGATAATPVGVAAAVTRRIQTADEFSGRLEATETVELRPRVSGYIAKLHFRAGQHVARGQLLFSIDAAPYQAEFNRAQAQLASALSAAELAKSELRRAQALLDQQAISQQEHEQISTTLQTQAAAVQAAQAALETARLNLGYCQIRAPIAGRISRTAVTEGNLVAVGGSVLASIVSQDQVYAYFDASEATYLRYLKQSQGPMQGTRQAPVAIRMGLLDETGFPHQGHIDAFDNRVDAQTGAIRTRAVFANPQRLLTTGLYARLQLMSSAPFDAVLTPDRAVGTSQDRRYLMVVGDDSKVQYREVKLGPLLQGMRVVSAGLQPGERVIVDGLQRVRPGMAVSAQTLQLDEHGQPAPASAAAAPSASSASATTAAR